MNLFQATILGIVQGITEFIPVSSSGHLYIIPEVFGWQEHSTAFDIIIHAGTLMALLIYFRKDLMEHIYKFDRKLFINIFFAAVPVLAAGYFLEDFFTETLKSLSVVIFTMVLVGILLIVSDFVFKKNVKQVEDLKPAKAGIIGISQIFSLIRGISRSGITIIGGLTQGLSRKEAARFSFLISIPVTAAVVGAQALRLMQGEVIEEKFPELFAGLVTSFISGYLAIKFMLTFLEKRGLKIFGIYRLLLAGILIILFSF